VGVRSQEGMSGFELLSSTLQVKSLQMSNKHTNNLTTSLQGRCEYCQRHSIYTNKLLQNHATSILPRPDQTLLPACYQMWHSILSSPPQHYCFRLLAFLFPCHTQCLHPSSSTSANYKVYSHFALPFLTQSHSLKPIRNLYTNGSHSQHGTLQQFLLTTPQSAPVALSQTSGVNMVR
jgi:hypothetical protein